MWYSNVGMLWIGIFSPLFDYLSQRRVSNANQQKMTGMRLNRLMPSNVLQTKRCAHACLLTQCCSGSLYIKICTNALHFRFPVLIFCVALRPRLGAQCNGKWRLSHEISWTVSTAITALQQCWAWIFHGYTWLRSRWSRAPLTNWETKQLLPVQMLASILIRMISMKAFSLHCIGMKCNWKKLGFFVSHS